MDSKSLEIPNKSEIITKYLTIVGSAVIYPNSRYNISITTYNIENKIELKIGVKSSKYDNNKIVTIEPFKNETYHLEIGELEEFKDEDENEDEIYKLYAEALNGFDDFKKEIDLKLQIEKVNIFIQTDKALYKPGDCVKFRVLFLDRFLKMYQGKHDITIKITDPKYNLLKFWKNIELIKGVFTSEYQLTSNAFLGSWHIKVHVSDEEETLSFKVAEYILPKFNVKIHTTPNVCIDDDKILVTVTANYTNGKPIVDGELVLTAKNDNYKSYSDSYKNRPFEYTTKKTFPFNEKHVEEYFFNDFNINKRKFDSKICIRACVTDKLTGMKSETETEVHLHENRYEILFEKERDSYQSGLPLYGKIYVKNIDGTPVSGENNFINFRYYFEKDDDDDDDNTNDDVIEEKIKLNSSGIANIKIDIPPEVSHFECTMKYLNEEKVFETSINDSQSSYIQIRLLTEKILLNEEIECEFQSTEELKSLYYQIIGGGNIINSNTIPMNNEKFGTFKFLSTIEMIPNCKLLVYFYSHSGEFFSDSIELKFPPVFNNKIEINLSNDEVKPGEEVDLIINTSNDSFVGLLGVDQSVLFLKGGNDLDSECIISALNVPNCRVYNYKRDDNILDKFKEAGAVLLTNIEIEGDPDEDYSYWSKRKISPRGGVQPTIPCNFKRTSRNDISFRNKFPETWIFEDIKSYKDKTIIRKQVPDTITSWILTGFAIDSILGFGMTEQPSKLRVFKPFFVSLNLPYSIKCGEFIEIPVVVYNYTNQDLTAEVTFDNSKNDFEFKENENKIKIINIESNNGNSVKFLVRAKHPGYKTIKIQAITSISGDGIEKELLVEPDGITKYGNKAFLIDLRENKEFSKEILLDIPEDIIPDSTRIDVSIIGDVLGPVVENLDKLIKLPSGCGEQNMLNFVPNLVILDYLTKVNKLTETIKEKVIKYLENGYQRELIYARHEGSFSAFGNDDEFGSTWLTAFVVKSFQQAKKYIFIEKSFIEDALDWLCKQQIEDGSFQEKGNVLYKEMQGGSTISLTSYVLIAFLQCDQVMEKYKVNIENALNYILNNIEEKINDIYTLIVTTYTMLLFKHSKASEFMEKLISKGIKSDDHLHWEHPNYKGKNKSNLYEEASSINVELTSYAVLCYVESNLIIEAIPIMKWLIGQRNKKGGFSSTQDTIMGIEALSKIAGHINTNDINIKMSTLQDNNETATLEINSENSNILQSNQLSSNSRKINISGFGNGVAIGQISFKYNIPKIEPTPSFKLDIKSEKLSSHLIMLVIKANYIPNTIENDFISNMTVMEVKFPSGYIFDKDTLNELKKFKFIRKIETKDSDTILILYFDNLGKKELTMNVCGCKEYNVEEQKPSLITIYDYYNNSRRANTFYEL